jgi:hypothetical protein
VAANSIAPTFASFRKRQKRGDLARWTGSTRTSSRNRTRRRRQQTFTLGALACQLAGTANGFRLLTRTLLGRLLVMSAHLHFTEDAFTLHFLLQSAKRLVNIIVADEYLHGLSCLSVEWSSQRRIALWLRGSFHRELRRVLAESPRIVHSRSAPALHFIRAADFLSTRQAHVM